MKTKQIPFDLEKAKAGAKVVTRDGRDVRIVCWDVKDEVFPIVAIISNKEGEDVEIYTSNGKVIPQAEMNGDLLLLEEVQEPRIGYINIYTCGDGSWMGVGEVYETERDAKRENQKDYITDCHEPKYAFTAKFEEILPWSKSTTT